NHTGGPQDYRAIRQTGGRPQAIRRQYAVHAVESELSGRDADHFRMGALVVPEPNRELGVSKQSNGASNFRDAFDRLAALCRSGSDDFLLQLFLGRDSVSPVADL